MCEIANFAVVGTPEKQSRLKLDLKRKDMFLLPCLKAISHLLTHVHSTTATPGSVEAIDFRIFTRSRYTTCSLWRSM